MRTKEIEFAVIGPNPLPSLRDDFVGRAIVGRELRIKPILPRPSELAEFNRAALEAGFRPARGVLWGSEKFPAFYRRPVDAQQQMDWRAADHFRRLARFAEETGNYASIADERHYIGDNMYRAHITVAPDGPSKMVIFRHGPDADGKPCELGVEIEAITIIR
jgi:hypothetical protein